MDDRQIAALAKGMVPFVREVVAEAVAPLVARIEQLDARPIEKGPEGPSGSPGPAGPPGPIGDPGRDGRDAADLALLRNYIDERVGAALDTVFKSATITTPDNGRTLERRLRRHRA